MICSFIFTLAVESAITKSTRISDCGSHVLLLLATTTSNETDGVDVNKRGENVKMK